MGGSLGTDLNCLCNIKKQTPKEVDLDVGKTNTSVNASVLDAVSVIYSISCVYYYILLF